MNLKVIISVIVFSFVINYMLKETYKKEHTYKAVKAFLFGIITVGAISSVNMTTITNMVDKNIFNNNVITEQEETTEQENVPEGVKDTYIIKSLDSDAIFITKDFNNNRGFLEKYGYRAAYYGPVEEKDVSNVIEKIYNEQQ